MLHMRRTTSCSKMTLQPAPVIICDRGKPSGKTRLRGQLETKVKDTRPQVQPRQVLRLGLARVVIVYEVCRDVFVVPCKMLVSVVKQFKLMVWCTATQCRPASYLVITLSMTRTMPMPMGRSLGRSLLKRKC